MIVFESDRATDRVAAITTPLLASIFSVFYTYCISYPTLMHASRNLTVYHSLTAALQQSGRLSNTQFGFRANRSTVSLLLSAVHDWSFCLELR